MSRTTTPTPDPSDDCYVYPVLEGTDWREHTDGHEFCDDPTCPCKQDQEAIDSLNGYYQDGLVSAADADRIYQGHTLR
jgi:hypothetical protein